MSVNSIALMFEQYYEEFMMICNKLHKEAVSYSFALRSLDETRI